jgi:hypothetical protein
VSQPSAEAAERIEAWLLASGAQLTDGPQRGGVAGRLAAGGRPEYVYLEITGYFLTAMAWLTVVSPGRARTARERGDASVDWLRRALAARELPDTRLHLRVQPDDWRNRAVFTFDLAMAVRGAGCFGADEPARQLAERVAAISPGPPPLASHALREPAGRELEERWSTRPGPHHIKAAAALLTAPGDALEETCRATVERWTDAMLAGWPCPQLHPLLYGIEGLLMLGAHASAGQLFKRLLTLQAEDGALPAEVGGDGVRADVLAQALRAGAILRAAGELRDADERLDALAQALLQYVGPDGGVRFAAGQEEANTWCAMFAHQALLLHAHPGDGELAATAARLLV